MIRKVHGIKLLILLTAALNVATALSAGLNDEPPQGITLASTRWQIDPHRSDDPNSVIDKAMEDMLNQARGASGGNSRGEPGGSKDVLDNSTRSDGPWSDRTPSDESDRSGSRGRRTSTDVDPLGGTQSATIQWGSSGPGRRNPFLEQLSRNPDKLAFLQVNEQLKVSADGSDTTCAPGVEVPIADSYGDGELVCGWDRRAWVVETTRGKQFTRKDRYELSKDGKKLRYITTASGKELPKIRISRTYTLAPAPE